MTGPLGGSFFLTHAPAARLRLSLAFPADRAQRLDEAERALGEVYWQSDVAVAEWVVSRPFNGMVALALLADEPPSLAAARIREVLPELYGLAIPTVRTSYEHDVSFANDRDTPLLDRTIRALGYALPRLKDESPEVTALATGALLFSDVAKGGTSAQREAWRTRLGVDGTVHNEDSAAIFDDAVRRILGKAALSEDGRYSLRVSALCAVSGLVGMRLRGEIDREAFGPFRSVLREEPKSGRDLLKAWSVLNACEILAVRSSLFTEAAERAFLDEERAIAELSDACLGRAPLSERLARMRHGLTASAAQEQEHAQALLALGSHRQTLESRLVHSSIWYAEPVLGALSTSGAIRLLVYLSGAAARHGIDVFRPWHLDLYEIVSALRDAFGKPKRYPVRLLEVLLASTPIEDLLGGRLVEGSLVTVVGKKGGDEALSASFCTTDEVAALITLLPIYESKTSVAFHTTLKALSDLYGLRKDQFDRAHNEDAYLATMDAARSDKSRMVKYAKEGLVVEIGPGSGVVLELLARALPNSRIVGLDASQAVIEAHRRHGPGLPYEMQLGRAEDIASHFGAETVSTVVFCSVLHEVWSYTEVGPDKKRFSIESLETVVKAAWKALEPSGRIIVRDGVMPPDEPRLLDFVDPSWFAGFRMFAELYEPRPIPYVQIDDRTVRLSRPDLYEFLTTYTWGPDAFPYEIREQRAVMSRADYVAWMIKVLSDDLYEAVSVDVDPDLESYLQPGYPANIQPYVKIWNRDRSAIVPMDDVNGVWVIEKRRR